MVFSTVDFSADFVAGFWDADGDVNREHPRLHNTDLRLLQVFQLALKNRFCVESRIRVTTPAGSRRVIRGVEIVSGRPIYCLQVSRGSRVQWAQMMGVKLRNPRKFEAVDNWQQNPL